MNKKKSKEKRLSTPAATRPPKPVKPAKSGSNPLFKKLALAVIFPLICFAVVEAGLRIVHFQYKPREKILWKPTVSGFIGTYEFYIQTEFSPPGYIWLSQPGTPYTDSYGFRRPEIPIVKPAGKIRVAFLGGSTTHGGYRPYPERAIRLINDAIGTNRYEMLNVACSSYSSHQSVIALDRWVLPRKPDIVFVYHGWNDIYIAVDGYSDKEKDAMMSITGNARMTMPEVLRGLKITSMLGKIAQSFDRTWPRQRIAFDEFEHNLDYIAQKCASNNIKMIVMIRPVQVQEDLKFDPIDPTTTKALFDLGTYHTDDEKVVYKKQADSILEIQRKIADRYDHVEACDGQAVLNNIIERNHRHEFGDKIDVFHSDNCHLFDFADELLAQQVALSIAPQYAVAISNRINSASYSLSMAEELIREDSPREGIWFIKQANSQNPTPEQTARLQELQKTAEGNLELVDLFREGKWGGEDPNFDSKMTKLKRCLEIRPTDYGIMIQIYRVCIYMNRMEEAAPAMVRYQPQTPQQKYEWLQYSMESHLQGKRWKPARRCAEELVKLNPQHQMALSVLQQIPANL